MSEIWLIIAGLAAATFTIRVGGVLIGRRLPSEGVWARALNALPGSLIIALVSVSLLSGGPREWLAALVAMITAMLTRNLPLTMLAGIAAIFLLRQM
ncbi:MAG: AzlD domain-containing protein [Hyphomicrobiales bacterium]|nr:MAG: AzlD domain-containing protein [Hyphomicrobiales bacterium]